MQDNCCNCGIYTLLFAQSLLQGYTVQNINTADIDMFCNELWQCLYNNLFLFNTKNTLKHVPPEICDLTTDGNN